NIEDPKGKSIEEYRKARDVIKQKVKKLVGGMGND
ncbi:MAG: arsenate reductase ArsC, partial [Thermoplasmata archaeon]